MDLNVNHESGDFKLNDDLKEEETTRMQESNDEARIKVQTDVRLNDLKDETSKDVKLTILDEFDPLANQTNKSEQQDLVTIGQTNLESDNFSQTNLNRTDIPHTNLNRTDIHQTNQTDAELRNVLQSANLDEQQEDQPQCSRQLHFQKEAKKLHSMSAGRLDLTSKRLNDFLKPGEILEAKETNLPDLISSTDKKQPQEAERKNAIDEDMPSYQVKWIKFRNKQCAIIMQNVNGCCPLLAIMNVLLLRGKIQLPPSTKLVTYDQMIVFLANFILENGTNNAPAGFQLDYEANINDAMQLFPKLNTGLNVNVAFNSITSFEYTNEMIIFDLLGISLYHGWIVDQDDFETVNIVGNCSYNQLVDKIITNKSSNKSEEVTEALIAERFLENTASQLTYYGLSELVSNVREQELSILFRNNHFITLYKNQNQLFQLVTDQGFLQEPDVVWMTLSHIDNDDVFVNHEFKASSTKSTSLSPTEQKKQIDQDYLIALSIEEEEKKIAASSQLVVQDDFGNELNTLNDEELARKLQEEEDLKEEMTHQEFLKKKYPPNRLKSYNKAQQYQESSQSNHQLNHHSQLNHSQLNQVNRNDNEPKNNESLSNKRGNLHMNSTASENYTQSQSSSRSSSHHRHSRHHQNKTSRCIIS